MSNPARELHTLVSGWRDRIADSGGTLYEAFDPRDAPGSRQLALFYSLAGRLDVLLSDYEARNMPVSLYRRQMINWMRIPLGLNGAWSQGVPRDQAIPPDWVDQIESLALYLDGKVYEFGGELLDSLQAIVDSAVDLLAADESLPIDLRRYIHDLLMSIRTALSHERVGLTFDFANAVRQLYVAFAAAELRSEKKSDFWSALGRRIVFDGASHAAVSGLTALATIAITAG